MRINQGKGVTLIELLAVIIILVIIALISTLIILGVKKNARNIEMNNTLDLIEAANSYYASSVTNPASYPISPTTNILNNIT